MNTNQNPPIEFAGLDDWFEVFRAGEQTDSKGRKHTFTQTDLDSIVANHTEDSEAPFVFGHPKTNEPAYGWTDGLKREGDILLAKGKNIVTEFSDAVEKKMFPKRSVSIEPADDGWKLRHIGFLGAKRPAVEGLKDIAFAADDTALEFSMSDNQKWGTAHGLSIVGRMMRRVRDWVIDEKDLATADNLIPDYEIESIQSAAESVRNSDAQPSYRFSSPTPEELNVDQNTDKQFTQADIDAAVESAREEEQTAASKRESKLNYSARLKDAQEMVSGLTAKGHLLPAHVDGMAEFIASLPDQDNAAFEFTAADADKATKKTPADFMTGFLGKLGKQIELGETISESPDVSGPSDFAAPNGYTVDPDRAGLHKKALEYAAKHNVEFEIAAQAVEGGQS